MSRVFAALADPTRRRILTRLTSGETTVGNLAAPFAMSGPAVSQHLKVLERAGLVARESRAQWRIVSLRRQPLDDVASWIDEHRRAWDERLDHLEDRIRQRNEGAS